jgi:signal transduction histidine kinase
MSNFIKQFGLAALMALAACGSVGAARRSELSLTQLQQRLAAIDAELDQLADCSLRSGIGSIGFHSGQSDGPDQSEWVEIELEREMPIDEVVLVPVIRRDSQERFMAEGFPAAFRVFAGTDMDRAGVLVAEYGPDQSFLPRIAPLVVPAGGRSASWVRVEATQLTKQARSKKYLLQLAEIMIFSEEENVALRRPVKASSAYPVPVVAWNEHFLVDGHMPYLMDAATGIESDGYVSPRMARATLTVDLGEVFPISRIQLHALNVINTVPQANSGDLGIPSQLRVEGARRADFSDAKPLVRLWRKKAYSVGPIMMWNVPEHACRYVRVSELDSRVGVIGFAEIELFSTGRNVALGKTVRAYPAPAEGTEQALAALTDGRNLYGDILPVRQWVNQLARRHDLETERLRVLAELDLGYARQRAYLRRMIWVATLLGMGIVITILIEKIIRQRVVFKTRERIAANLHDELGANLHAIGLFGDLAKKEANKCADPERWGKLIKYVDEVRSLTIRTGKTARYCTNMLEAKEIHENLAEEIKRESNRLLVDLEHALVITGARYFEQLKPRRRIDLFLFYKECLVNIIRHSGATRVDIQITATADEIILIVTDNGRGLVDGAPASLRRRAQLLKAALTADTPADGGTRIRLELRNQKKKRKPSD